MADQLDLTVLDAQPGLRLYQNLAWAPVRSVLPAGVRVPAGAVARRDPVGAALTTDMSDARRLATRGGPGTAYVGDEASDAWSATLDGSRLQRIDAFGWANGWVVPRSGRLTVTLDEPLLATMVPIAQIVGWTVVVAALLGVRRRRRSAGQDGVDDVVNDADRGVVPEEVAP
jgi:hypothetical protein